MLLSSSAGAQVRAWVLDERKAYRQVAIDPAHRKFSVVAFRHFEIGKVAYFIMIGHSFGLVSAVYTYNLRSALVNEILQKIFMMISFNFYDDKYGFETNKTIHSAMECAQSMHQWLGAMYDQKKLQLGQLVDILGITYDFSELILRIKEGRKEELLEEIKSILVSGLLEPGHAGKLKGKLCLRPLSSGVRLAGRSSWPSPRDSTLSRLVRTRKLSSGKLWSIRYGSG